MTEVVLNIDILHLILFFLIIIQSILGVGILVLGTPILLFLNYNLPDVISILLPISILTSLINIFIIKGFNFQNIKKGSEDNYIPADKNLKNIFYFVCLPSVFIGLIVLKSFGHFMNFKIIISFVIFFSLLIKIIFENKIYKINSYKKKFFLFLIGLIHGITNSGGTLLALMISSINTNFKLESRINITFFYLILATTQYLIFLIMFAYIPNFSWIALMSIIIVVGSLIGNNVIKIINQSILKRVIDVLALMTAIFLFIDGLGLIKFN